MEYSYGIIASITFDEESKLSPIKLQSEQMEEVNCVLREHFNDPRYTSHMDHLMLFNMFIDTVNVIYVRTLSPITHELFIPSEDLAQKIGSRNEITLDDVYDSYPSIRFDKFFQGTYVDYESPNSTRLVFGVKSENSHRLNIY